MSSEDIDLEQPWKLEDLLKRIDINITEATKADDKAGGQWTRVRGPAAGPFYASLTP